MFANFRSIRPISSRRGIAIAAVLGVVSALSLPAVAHADPVTVYQSTDDLTYSILITQDGYSGSGLGVTITNLGPETTTYGVAADLETQSVMEDLWDPSVLGTDAEATIASGDSYEEDLPSWPGTTMQFYSNVDTTAIPIGGTYTTPGTHIRTVISTDASGNLSMEVGPNVTWSPDPVLPGAGLAVTASQMGSAGPVEVYLDQNPGLDWSGPDFIETPGTPLEDIGSGVVAGDGTVSLEGVLPVDTPPGQYQIEFTNSSGVVVHFSTTYVNVDSGTPDTVSPGTVAITGKAKVNGTLSADAESWTAPGVQLQYQWSADGAPIQGATSSTFVPTNAQLGTAIRVAVTGWAAGEAPSAPVTSALVSMPVGNVFASTPSPVISGTDTVGQKLTASVAAWTPTTGFSYQWDVNGLPVGTDAKTYTLAPADASGTVTVTVTSTKAGYAPSQEQSDSTAPVALGQIQSPANANRPSIGGQEKVAGTVTLKLGNWTPTPTFGVQWFIAGVAVPGATGTSLTVPATANGVSTIGSLISAQLIASSAGYQDYPVTVSDPTAITKAAKTS